MSSPSGPPDLPADLAAVQADDALLDELGIDLALLPDADLELVRFLLAWRRDVLDVGPLPSLVDIDTALAIVRTHSRRSLASRVADAVRRIADAVRRLIGGDR